MTEARYCLTYSKNARQLASFDIAREWYVLGNVSVELAVAFANKGFMPGEAVALIGRVANGTADRDDIADLIAVGRAA